MSSIENILDKISSASKENCNEAIKTAEDKAKAILDSKREEAAKECGRIQCDADKQAQAAKGRVASGAQLQCRKNVLFAKQEMIDLAFEKALEKLCSSEKDELYKLIADMAKPYISTGDEEILICSAYGDFAKDIAAAVKAAAPAFGGKISVSDRVRDAGFVIKCGDIEYNKTFASLIRENRETLEAQVVSALFD